MITVFSTDRRDLT